mmetsp:Transcript_18884/g.41593  ORF Transcript_18884/g.41593 Transcript_18884/m.41593 type:complete len:96 (+) Transcript_18884:560-847(+)
MPGGDCPPGCMWPPRPPSAAGAEGLDMCDWPASQSWNPRASKPGGGSSDGAADSPGCLSGCLMGAPSARCPLLAAAGGGGAGWDGGGLLGGSRDC